MPTDITQILRGTYDACERVFFGSLPESFSSGFPQYLVGVCCVDLGVSLSFVTKTISSDFLGWRRGLPHLRLKPFKTDLSALVKFPWLTKV